MTPTRLLTAAFAMAAALLFADLAVGRPPNIVLIVVDDLGYGDLGCYGSQTHSTPNIDALARHGVRLTDFHSNGAVCSPTRAALITGQYQQRCGIEHALGFGKELGMALPTVTVAERLQALGYRCGVVGKWHLGHVDRFGPQEQGFPWSYCSNNSPDYHTHISRIGERDWYKDGLLHEETGYLTEIVTQHAMDFIEQDSGVPFFLFVSHIALHFPFQGPTDPPHRTAGHIWHDEKYGPLEPDDYRRAYRDMLAAVDESVGEVMQKLDDLGLRDSTLVVLVSDNGAYSWVGSNGGLRGQKGDLYEGGHRIPAIVCWPGQIGPGQVNGETTMTMDLAPTFLSIAGGQTAKEGDFDGIDLSDLLRTGTPLPARQLFWRFNNPYTDTHAHAVREECWKYVNEGGQDQLFDLCRDPGEQQDLSSTHGEVVDRLRAAYAHWERSVAETSPSEKSVEGRSRGSSR